MTWRASERTDRCAYEPSLGVRRGPLMPSTIAWLDASREEQRRMREVINFFTQLETTERHIE